MIYIDADHSYEGCKRDLNISFKKVKSGGYIMGHDYEMNMNKAQKEYSFGVKQAVDEFCISYNQRICAKGFDGCVSYAIQKNSLNTNSTVHIKSEIDSLDTIFSKYNTDKGSNFHNYTRQYETLLKDYRNKPIKYLEIGVFNGGSVKAFRELFKNSTCILGLDIESRCKIYEDVKNNIFIEIGDATDSDFIKKITELYGSFDIILDDGSHTNRDVIKSFELLFPLLNDDGLYIVEDTICYKSGNYIDLNYENHLQYFFNYTKYLNQWRFDSTEGVLDNCVDPFKIQKTTANVFEYSIDKIEYGCSYIAISKKVRTHWIKR
jgi:cephalosporin hydroxylase